jgi:hypothetical protein
MLKYRYSIKGRRRIIAKNPDAHNAEISKVGGES